MSHRGDVTLGDTLDLLFTTVGTTGAPTQLAGSPVVSAYVGNSTTQITAGITLDVDFDGVTGLNHVRVVASVGNGYATGTNVDLVITTGTVGGTSVVGYVVGSFSIGARSAFARLGAPAGASVSADVAALQTGVNDLPTNAELATALGAADDAVLAAVAALPTATQNADAALKRDWTAVTGEADRSMLNALRHIRNKWDTTSVAGYVVVRKEDDTTEAWRAALSTDAAATPITGSDPA